MSVIVENAIDIALEREVPDILCSALTDDCIGRGKHLKEGGAIYDYISGLQVGIANLSDSLAAIKKLVFEEGRLTPEELWHALETDYTGERGKEIQEMLIEDAPKYGNDDDYADQLVTAAYDIYIDEIAKYPNTRFGRGPIVVSVIQVHHPFQPMSDRGVVRWQLQTVAMQAHRWQKVVLHHIIWIKMDRHPF